jgi:hypothetical protein
MTYQNTNLLAINKILKGLLLLVITLILDILMSMQRQQQKQQVHTFICHMGEVQRHNATVNSALAEAKSGAITT